MNKNSQEIKTLTEERALKEMEACLKELTSTSLGRRSFLYAVPLLMVACATQQKTRYREGDNTGQAASLSVTDERRMTREVLPKMKKDYPPVPNQALQNYVSTLGQNLVRANGLDGNPYRYSFTVVDVPFVNAFALPAGTVFVTAPLMEMAESEAELMGVIGHEVGHIKARHTAERMYKAEKAQSKSWLYALGGGALGGAVGLGLGHLLCRPRDQKCLQRATQLGAVAGVGGGLLVQKYAFMANSREDEMEADRIGFRTSVQSGYHKDHVGRFYEKLLKMEQDSKRRQIPIVASIADAMSTHPPSRERVNQMKQMAARSPKGAQGQVSSHTFEQAKQLASRYAQRARQRAKG